MSTDYLLGRTDDPTDYSNPDLIAETNPEILDHFDGDVQKAVEFQEAVDQDALKEKNAQSRILSQYCRLDATDRAIVDAFIQGRLADSKYSQE